MKQGFKRFFDKPSLIMGASVPQSPSPMNRTGGSAPDPLDEDGARKAQPMDIETGGRRAPCRDTHPEHFYMADSRRLSEGVEKTKSSQSGGCDRKKRENIFNFRDVSGAKIRRLVGSLTCDWKEHKKVSDPRCVSESEREKHKLFQDPPARRSGGQETHTHTLE